MKTASIIDPPDPAAVFGAAHSLWNTCRRYDRRTPLSQCIRVDPAPHDEQQHRPDGINLSESYNGMDQFMRVVMDVANRFEEWACKHVNFDELEDVWPYLLQDRFGDNCISVMRIDMLEHFDEEACLAVAMQLRLPIKLSEGLHVPVDVRVTNTVAESEFKEYRIQTVRLTRDLDFVEPYVMGDYPYDENFGDPYFGVYGVNKDGTLEHIADRDTYVDAVDLVQKVSPNANFPKFPQISRLGNDTDS